MIKEKTCLPTTFCIDHLVQHIQSKSEIKGCVPMILGRVTGSIVSTRKNSKLVGCKLMLVQQIENNTLVDKYIVAVDQVGAGIGENVLVATGSAARLAIDRADAPVDATIVGIVD